MKKASIHIYKLEGEETARVSFDGTEIDLIKLLALAMDVQVLRRIFYKAVKLDKEHDRMVGRRQDIK